MIDSQSFGGRWWHTYQKQHGNVKACTKEMKVRKFKISKEARLHHREWPILIYWQILIYYILILN